MDSAIEQPDPAKILDLANIRFQLMHVILQVFPD